LPLETDYEQLIEPVKSRRTFEEVSERLKELIFNGTLKPGQQLPREPALARLFGVGCQAVKEARRVLELSGFIAVFKNADKEDIERLRSNIMTARKKLHSNISAYEENIDFHRLLAKASKNSTFSIVMESIMAVFCNLKSRHVSVDLKESRGIVDLHDAIVDALVSKKRPTAAGLFKEDLAAAERIMRGGRGSAPVT
jgi:DNA-binding FadR family transcriptional regulator